MAQIEISDTVYEQVAAFKPVVESILEVSLEFDRFIELLLKMAPDFILSDVLGHADPPALIQTIEELARRNPKPVYSYLAEELHVGREIVQEDDRPIAHEDRQGHRSLIAAGAADRQRQGGAIPHWAGWRSRQRGLFRSTWRETLG